MEPIYAFMRRSNLVRPTQGRLVAGVCAGLGRALGMDANLVRLLFVASFLLPGPQLVLYFLAWFLMPDA